MNDTLVVLLDGEIAGTVSLLDDRRLRFDYSAEYQARDAPTPLSCTMPVAIGSHPHEVISPWLWNLLPENEGVLARWAREFHVSAASAFSLLSSPVGEDCAGAVQFVRPERLGAIQSRAGAVRWLTEAQVAQRLRDLRADATAWLGEPFSGQFSLAGAQAKTALLRDGDRWGVPAGPTPTTHIIKPAIPGLDDHDLNEHLCLAAARGAGLLAARSTVHTFEDQAAVVVERYDRFRPGNDLHSVRRVHQEDLCQALGLPPSAKYQSEGGPSPAAIAALIRDVMPPGIAASALERFCDALIWNWLTAGTDAHAKNYSLLISGAQIRLAPLYDLASALPYGIHERKLRLAMKIGSSYEVALQHNRWPDTAAELRLDPDAVVERARVLADQLPSAFADAAGTPAITALHSPLPGRLVDLMAERARRCRRLLDEPG